MTYLFVNDSEFGLGMWSRLIKEDGYTRKMYGLLLINKDWQYIVRSREVRYT